jgi:anhydro-N-acetylmuramic acid kinase
MSELYIGLMSGTSIDSIDAVLVDLSSPTPILLAHHNQRIPTKLQQRLRSLNHPQPNEINIMAQADVQLGKLFAKAVNTLLKQSGYQAQHIIAIGSHGQNIRHNPNSTYPFTLQIADPNTISAETNITTVADFRRKDIALGGGGAPLTPAFHHAFMSVQQPCVILNIGGIANITLLQDDNIMGFDTGPGNCLIDNWFRKFNTGSYDKQGSWASQGHIIESLLKKLLQDKYFHQLPPKCTGTEYFNLSWFRFRKNCDSNKCL